MYNVKEYITFENARGEKWRFDSVSIEGLGDVAADIQQQRAPFMDGSIYLDTIYEPRYINIEFIVAAPSYDEVVGKRRTLAGVVNAKLGLGTLTYETGDRVNVIEAVAESVPFFPDKENRGKRWQRGTITFVCPNPYWKSTEVTEEPAFEPLFEFPSDVYWEDGEDGDLYFEMGLQRTERIIHNDGDAAAPFSIEFFGPADAPYIENTTTGEFIQINKRLEEGETLVVDTGERSVVYVDSEGNETNVFNWLDLGSTFFDLELGDNEITCNCVISNNAKDFDIYYSKLYTAV